MRKGRTAYVPGLSGSVPPSVAAADTDVAEPALYVALLVDNQ